MALFILLIGCAEKAPAIQLPDVEEVYAVQLFSNKVTSERFGKDKLEKLIAELEEISAAQIVTNEMSKEEFDYIDFQEPKETINAEVKIEIDLSCLPSKGLLAFAKEFHILDIGYRFAAN